MKHLHPELWVSPRPNGVGLQKPNHFGDMAKVAWTNKKHAKYAWNVLTKGVCDGCALGVAGLHDWTIEGTHLCLTRLRLLEVNCADPIDHSLLGDVEALRRLDGKDLRDLGRLAHPMRRRKGEKGFRRVSWDEAFSTLADGVRATDPERVAVFLTSRGITNETYYVAGKAARALGIANVDSAARICHAPSTTALKGTIGAAATTCSLSDVLDLGPDRDLGRQPRRQPARVHEVPPQGPRPRHQGRGREPVPGAGTRALLGAVQLRVGPVRHQDVRPARAGAARRRRGAGRCRCSSA